MMSARNIVPVFMFRYWLSIHIHDTHILPNRTCGSAGGVNTDSQLSAGGDGETSVWHGRHPPPQTAGNPDLSH